MDLNRRIFNSISILSSNNNERVKPRNVLFGIVVFILQVTLLISSLTYCYQFTANDLENSLYALLQICVFLSAAYTIVVALRLRRKINELFDQVHQIQIDYVDSLTFRYEADRRGEKLTKILVLMVTAIWFFSSIFLCVFSYIWSMKQRNQVDVNQLYHLFKCVWPWNQQELTSWIFGEMIAHCAGLSYLFINNSFLAFFVVICEYHRGFRNYLRSLISKSDALTDGSRCDQYIKLCHILREFIRFHISAKEIFGQSADVFSPLILIQLVCSMIFLSGSLFQIDMAINHLDLKFFIMLMAALVGGMNLFLYSFFGHLATNFYLNLSDDLFESKWHRFPLNLQKYLMIMMGNAQQPLHYHGSGITHLNLYNYLKILKTVFSYYMMFKTLMNEH